MNASDSHIFEDVDESGAVKNVQRLHKIVSCVFGLFFGTIGIPVFTYASNWMLAAVTTDRFFKLYKPFIQQGRNSKYATYIGVSCLYLVCSLMAIPIFFKFQLNPEQLSVNGQSKLSTTPFSKSSGYFMWEIWVHCWFLMALPLSVTVTVSFLILRQIKNSEQNHGGKKNMNMQITRMILKTVTFFVIRIAVQCIGQCLLLAFVSDKRISHELVWVTKVGSQIGFENLIMLHVTLLQQ
uniref:G-protein coupled receptors family 1 profile domain-containing protein n=1 Tax=Magallana gigas TaxID=29159 RepID=A0A8W8P6Z0_MAGGI